MPSHRSHKCLSQVRWLQSLLGSSNRLTVLDEEPYNESYNHVYERQERDDIQPSSMIVVRYLREVFSPRVPVRSIEGFVIVGHIQGILPVIDKVIGGESLNNNNDHGKSNSAKMLEERSFVISTIDRPGPSLGHRYQSRAFGSRQSTHARAKYASFTPVLESCAGVGGGEAKCRTDRLSWQSSPLRCSGSYSRFAYFNRRSSFD